MGIIIPLNYFSFPRPLNEDFHGYFVNLVPPLLDSIMVCHFNEKKIIHVDEIKIIQITCLESCSSVS